MSLPPLPAALASVIGDPIAEPVLDGEAGATIVRLTSSDGTIRFLKYGTGSVADDIADEAARLRWLGGRLPCPDVLYFAILGDAAWLLTSGVPGRTGDAWLADDPANLNRVIDGYAAFLQRLHALPVDDCPYDAGAGVRLAAARRNLDAGLVDIDDFDEDHAGWSAEQVWDELMRLRPTVGARVVTHGDYSLGNLLLDDNGQPTGLIDVGRLGVADPYQDIAIFWQNLSKFGAAAQQRFLTAVGIDALDGPRLAFHRCLDEMF